MNSGLSVVIKDGDNDVMTTSQLIEIELPARENFSKIRETLERVVILLESEGEEESKNAQQFAFILHRRGRYFIAHYKQLQALDGDSAEIFEQEEIDLAIAAGFIHLWGLAKITDPDVMSNCLTHINNRERDVITIPYRDKRQWNLEVPYQIGKRTK